MYQASRRKLWTYYSLVDPINQICMCRVCGKHLKFKSTGNLKKHLIRLHSIKDVGRINETLPIIVKRKDFTTETQNDNNELDDSEHNSVSDTEETAASDNEDGELDITVSANITQPSSNTVSSKETPICSTVNKKIKLDIAPSNTQSLSNRMPFLKTPSAKVSNHRNEEHEFDLFCKSLAVQLKKLPLDRALKCQEKLLSVMIEERLKQYKTSSNARSKVYVPNLSNPNHSSNASIDNIINSSNICEDEANSNSSDF